MRRFRTAVAFLVFLVVYFPAQAEEGHLGDSVYIDNVVIVLDASGSMNVWMNNSSLSKMDVAKSALLDVLQHIPDSTNIGLLVFSGHGVDDEWVYPLGPRDDAKLTRAIKSPQPAGGTPLGEYIKKGTNRLLDARNSQHGYGSYRLLIVTDGEATDKHLVEIYTPEVIARGITVDVIGVNMAGDHTLATKVHSYRRANDPAALRQAIAEVFAEVSDSDAGGVAEEEAFEIIKSIPGEIAMSMLETLSASGNYPIGKNKDFSKYIKRNGKWYQPRRPTPAKASNVSGHKKNTTKKSDFENFKIMIMIAIFFIIMWARTRARNRNR
ncbi:MAG: VWA domain-containing protein [bacterium]|jgi:uncharacterized protein YegL|nr:VWA domain-containing protein [bacterium]